jgi:DHA1 family purine ribonucleoside efflux pump-like MFS transporter/DHA1 family L-arabinose/isopropyl-beta-D-thiogalactopyranoside export protein-like MFS transporter
VGVVLFVCLPKHATGVVGSFKTIAMLFKRKTLVVVYLVTLITMSGHYAAFTFITPFLQQMGGVPSERIASILLMYGVAGLLGGWISPYFLGARFQTSALVSVVIVAMSLFAFRSVASSYAGVLALVLIWGTAFLLFNLVLQNLVLAMAPDAEDVAMAGYSGIYNVGIGTGALIGSLCAAHNLGSIGYIGAACILAAFIIYASVLAKVPAPSSIASGH